MLFFVGIIIFEIGFSFCSVNCLNKTQFTHIWKLILFKFIFYFLKISNLIIKSIETFLSLNRFNLIIIHKFLFSVCFCLFVWLLLSLLNVYKYMAAVFTFIFKLYNLLYIFLKYYVLDISMKWMMIQLISRDFKKTKIKWLKNTCICEIANEPSINTTFSYAILLLDLASTVNCDFSSKFYLNKKHISNYDAI